MTKKLLLVCALLTVSMYLTDTGIMTDAHAAFELPDWARGNKNDVKKGVQSVGQNIVNILSAVIGVVAVVIFFVGLLQAIFQDDKSPGRSKMIWAAIGIVVTGVAYGLLSAFVV